MMNPRTYRSFSIILSIAVFGWLVALYFFAEYMQAVKYDFGVIGKFSLTFIIRLFEAVLVAGLIGFVIRKYLKSILDPEVNELEEHNIDSIFTSRSNASEELLSEVENGANNEIDIIGISLRDFLSGHGELSGVWNSILKRLRDPDDKLRVRILLLHPKSLVGHIRFDVEDKKFKRNDLTSDLPQSVNQLKSAYKTLPDSNNLEVRFYHDSSFAFAFICNNSIFIEQYSYRDHNIDSAFPLIEFNSKSSAYQQFKKSFDIQWDISKYSGIKEFEDVGTYPTVYNSGIKNIYSGDEYSRNRLGMKQISIIKQIESESIDILAFTGKFYFRNRNYRAIRDFLKLKKTIRFLFIDPVSEQAILRAVADNSLSVEEIKMTLSSWDWNSHQSAALFQDSSNIREKIRKLKSSDFPVQLRYTNAPITASMFISDSSIFIEQYLFGRSKDQDVVLGGEYPAIEFQVSDNEEKSNEVDIIRSSFDVLWNNYSKDFTTYNKLKQKDTFSHNLNKLQEYFNIKDDNAANNAPPTTHR